MLIDTHAHLTFPEFEADLPDVISRAKSAKVEAIINIALGEEAAAKSIKIAAEYPGYVFNAVGLHPQEASEFNASSYDKYKALAIAMKAVAIGETGLDYYYKLSSPEQQQHAFRQFLRLAQELDLPAIIHSREAASDTLNILREENQGKLKGVLHCFAGDMDLGKGALDLGLYISFTGNITFPKADKIRAAAKEIPLDRIMVETDCPFLAPQNLRGKRNEPSHVTFVAQKIAEIKGLNPEELEIKTTNNARNLFKLML